MPYTLQNCKSGTSAFFSKTGGAIGNALYGGLSKAQVAAEALVPTVASAAVVLGLHYGENEGFENPQTLEIGAGTFAATWAVVTTVMNLYNSRLKQSSTALLKANDVESGTTSHYGTSEPPM